MLAKGYYESETIELKEKDVDDIKKKSLLLQTVKAGPFT